MGCTYDIISVNIKKENKNDFIKLFNSLLEDCLYDDWCMADEDCFEDDGKRTTFGMDQEPVFTMMENGAQLDDVFVAFLAAHPDNDFYAEYECTFNNCGAMVLKYYTFCDGILKIHSKYAEEGYVTNCPECGCEGEDEDGLLCLADWDSSSTFTCPECGAELELEDASEDFEEIDVAEAVLEIEFPEPSDDCEDDDEDDE